MSGPFACPRTDRHLSILVTAFEPFGGDSENASYEAVRRLGDVPGCVIETRVLPVVFGAAPAALTRAIAEVSPDVVVCVGEAGSRSDITPETRAVNRAQASLADNSGYVACGEVLDAGPEYLPSRLPNEEIVGALTESGFPASLSDDAGAYLCNAVMRAALREFDGPAGFIHVPAVRSSGVATVGAETDAERPAHGGFDQMLTFGDLARALDIALETIGRTFSPDK